jgi:hypothetical protein
MDVHVSTMTGKLDGFRAINSNTGPIRFACPCTRTRLTMLSVASAIPMKC